MSGLFGKALLGPFERKPAVERIGEKILLGINTLTLEQARELAAELMKLAQEAELHRVDKIKRQASVNYLLQKSSAPLVMPSRSDIFTYARTQKEQSAVGHSRKSLIVVNALSPKPPEKSK